MANKNGNPGNLREPMRKGETMNPKGSSAKARARKAEKDRLTAIHRAVFGKSGRPDRGLAPALLQDCLNLSREEVLKLLQTPLVPTCIGVMLKEAAQNPDFALKIYNQVYGKDTPQKIECTGKDGQPLRISPITIEIIDTKEQVDEDLLNGNLAQRTASQKDDA